jgi:hypothetical protein
MAEHLRTLMTAIQGWVMKCRRSAAEKPDPKTVRLLLLIADKIDKPREVDPEKLKPQSQGRPMKKPPLG